MPDWMLIPFQYFVCMVMHFCASFWWQIDQALLLGAVMIHYFRRWLQNDVLDFTINLIFQPGNGNFLMAYIAGALGLAILLGGIFLLLRNLFVHSSPVDFRRIIFWVVLIGWLLSNRNSIFHDLEGFRNSLASGAYNTAAMVNDHIMQEGYNQTGGEVPSPSAGTITIPQLFPQTTHQYGLTEITALDATAYHLKATQDDIAQTNPGSVPLPTQFYQEYYVTGGTQYFPVPSDNNARMAAVSRAMIGTGLMFTGTIPSLVSLIQALISLLFTLSATILFFSLPIALPFSFFNATEVIAFDIIRAYLNLIIKTFVVNLLLAIFIGFIIYWGSSGNIAGFLAMSSLTLYLCFRLMRVAAQTFEQSVNALTNGIDQVTGTRTMDPLETAKQAIGKVTNAVVTAGAVTATGGAGALAGAGALMSSSGFSSAGSALVYSAAHRRSEPGDFARRALTRRGEPEVLSPREQDQAVRAAEVVGGVSAGDHNQAAATLTQLGARAAATRARQTAVRRVLAEAGIVQPEEAGSPAQRLERSLGANLRELTVTPDELEEAVAAAAVLEGHAAGDKTRAAVTLQRIGAQARSGRNQRRDLRAALTDAGVLTPEADEPRQRNLQRILGMHPDHTHLEPAEIEEVIIAAAVVEGQPEQPDEDAQKLLEDYGQRSTEQRSRQTAIRQRLIDAGILPGTPSNTAPPSPSGNGTLRIPGQDGSNPPLSRPAAPPPGSVPPGSGADRDEANFDPLAAPPSGVSLPADEAPPITVDSQPPPASTPEAATPLPAAGGTNPPPSSSSTPEQPADSEPPEQANGPVPSNMPVERPVVAPPAQPNGEVAVPVVDTVAPPVTRRRTRRTARPAKGSIPAPASTIPPSVTPTTTPTVVEENEVPPASIPVRNVPADAAVQPAPAAPLARPVTEDPVEQPVEVLPPTTVAPTVPAAPPSGSSDPPDPSAVPFMPDTPEPTEPGGPDAVDALATRPEPETPSASTGQGTPPSGGKGKKSKNSFYWAYRRSQAKKRP